MWSVILTLVMAAALVILFLTLWLVAKGENKRLWEKVDVLDQEIDKRDKVKQIQETANATVMHSLKDLLVGIRRLLTEVPQEQSASETKQHHALIVKDINSYLDYIKKMLNSFQTEQGVVQLRVEKFSLTKVLDDIRKRFSEKIIYTGYKLQVNINPDDKIKIHNYLENFTGNKEFLISIFNNLIQNALEAIPDFIPKEERVVRIDIKLIEDKPDWLKFSIHNIGKVPADKIADFFKKKQESAKNNGTGVGALVAALLTEYHEGQIYFETAGYKETIISIELPTYR